MISSLRSAYNVVRRSITSYRRGRWEATDDGEWLESKTSSGVPINRTTAYTSSYWWRAVNLISSTVAKTPLQLHDCRGNGRKPATREPGYKLLCGNGKPNEMTLKYHFKQTLTAHALGHGGGFAYIYRDEAGRSTELLQLRPDRTHLVKENGQYLFVTCIGGDYGDTNSEVIKMLPENVLHIHGLGWDGLTGYSLQEYAANTIGGALAKEHYGNSFFANSASPSVVVKTSKKMSDKAYNRLRKSWQELRTGLTHAHKPIILEDNEDVIPLSTNANDAQLVEAMERDPILIANFTSIPPYKLGVKGFNSYNSLEISSQDFLDDAIDPWFVPWEEELNDKLLTERQKASESHCFEFQRKKLVRIDHAKRMAGHRTALGGHPWAEVNEIRIDEGEDRKDGFDFIPRPLNMTGGPGAPAGDGGGDGKTSDDERAGTLPLGALRTLWRDTAARMARRIQGAVQRQSAVDENGLKADHGAVLRAAFGPLLELTGSEHAADDISAEMFRSVLAAGDSKTWVDDVVPLILGEILPDDEMD